MLCEVFVVLYFINAVTCDAFLPVEIQINGKHQNDLQQHTNMSKGAKRWVRNGTYKYFEGELLKFTCKNIHTEKTLWIKITSDAQRYENTSLTTGTLVTPSMEEVFLTVKLSKENNINYIDCYVGEKANSIDYHIRIELMYGETSNEAQLMNGLPANRIPCGVIDEHKKCFELESYSQEQVGEMRKVLIKNPNIHDCGQPVEVKQLECEVSNNDIHKIRLYLVDNVAAKFEPRITGLSMLKTLAMYPYNNSSDNSGSLVILYAYYASDKKLDLMCECTNSWPEWIVEENKINNTRKNNIVPGANNSIKELWASFVLKASHQFGKIVCKCGTEKDKTVTIRLIKQNTEKTDPFPHHTKPDMTKWIVIGIIVIVLLVIIVVIAFIFFKNKGNKSPSLLRNMADPNGEQHTSSIECSTINANDEIQYTVSYQPDAEEISSEHIERDNNIAENSVGLNKSQLYKYLANAGANSEASSENVRKNNNLSGNEVTYMQNCRYMNRLLRSQKLIMTVRTHVWI